LEWWSWILTAFGVSGIYLAGRKNKWGWVIGILSQFLWVAFAISTAQYGFILGSICYGSVYAMNFIKWRKEEK
jgi:nicotinamide riboside transporter PnuC